MTDTRSQPATASDMDLEVVEAIRIADKYLPGSPPEYRAQCANEILKAIISHATTIAMDVIKTAMKAGT